MLSNYTARYIKIDSGYMGQLLEWPEVVTEGSNLEDCRSMLKDALQEMTLAYKELGKEIPFATVLFEQIPVDIEYVS
ncbi:MAG: type II toxin-antitoxin system HicB family antitoxin [bacterium]